VRILFDRIRFRGFLLLKEVFCGVSLRVHVLRFYNKSFFSFMGCEGFC
jgi:alpha-N-acetylglucosamine transferase